MDTASEYLTQKLFTSQVDVWIRQTESRQLRPTPVVAMASGRAVVELELPRLRRRIAHGKGRLPARRALKPALNSAKQEAQLGNRALVLLERRERPPLESLEDPLELVG